MFLPWLTLVDFANIRANFVEPLDLNAVQTRSRNFALLVPIFNDLKYLTNIDFLKRYADRVILCTTDHETPEFVAELEALAARHGFRVSYSPVESGVKNPWAIYHKTLLAHDAVLKSTVERLTEKYVIFIDGDTYVDGDLSILAGAMEEKAWDISSVRVLPSKRETWMEHLQGVEYDIAMRARLLYPWLTSGAGMIARTEVMSAIMENHSLFFNGGDIEIGKLADMMGYSVGHIPMVFYTDIPSTFGKWVKQRRSWMCGMFRHSIINLEHNLYHPFHFIYFTFIIYAMYPFKLAEIISHPHLLPVILAFYVVATYIANWKVRSRWMLLFPLYALFQVMVLIWLGIYRYVQTVRKTGNIGKIRVRHAPAHDRATRLRVAFKLTRNLALIMLIVGIIALGTLAPIQYLVFGQEYNLLGLLGEGAAAALTGAVRALPNLIVRAQSLTQGQWSALIMSGLAVVAVGWLSRSIWRDASDPARVQAHHQGRLRRGLRRELELHERNIEIEPSSPRPYYAMARLLMRQRKLEQALHYFARALQLDPAAAAGKVTAALDFELRIASHARHLAEAGSRINAGHLYDLPSPDMVNDRALSEYLLAAGLKPSYADIQDFRALNWALSQRQDDVRTVPSRRAFSPAQS